MQLLYADIVSQKIDVVMICETWFSHLHSDSSVGIQGYTLFRRDRCKRKGGGVCIYVRDDIQCAVVNCPSTESADIEIIWIRLLYCNIEYFIACCYVPPKPKYSQAQLSGTIISNVEYFFNIGFSPIFIIAGDFNQHNTDFIETELGLMQIVKEPTHGPNILDKVFVNRPDIFFTTVISSLIKTKHLAVIVTEVTESSGVKLDKTGRKKISFADVRQHNIDKLRYMLSTIDWSCLYELNDIQVIYDAFLCKLRDVLHEAVPIINVTVGPRDPPFMTPLVKHLLQTRNKLFRKGKHQEGNELAQRINNIIANFRAKSLNNLENATSKELWDTVKPKTRSVGKDGLLSNVDSVNHYFSQISFDKSYSCKYHSNSNNVYLSHNYVSCDLNMSVNSLDTFSVDCVSYNCIEHLLRNLNSTAPGLDNIPSWVFKNCSYELCDVIAFIFKHSLLTGSVPVQWRQAVVTPIPKVVKPATLCDFRPISVTPILSRILEKIIVNNYLRPVLDNKILGDQFAYRPTGSTTSALIFLMHHVTKMLETNAYVRCLLIDFSKAFDVIEHDILLDKVARLNIPHNIFQWIVSFLQNRSQVVKSNQNISGPCCINKGVVQGSGLGPTLFSIMASDLRTISELNELCKYADDMNLLSPENTDISLTVEFENVLRWASVNKMIINVGKTKEIVFHKPNPRTFLMPAPLEGVERVNSVKLLGIILSNNLKFDMHIKSLLSQCSQRIYLIKLLRDQGLCHKKLNIIFQSLVVAKITYALPAWGGFITVALMDQINAFFRRAVKYKMTSKIFTIDELLKNSDRSLFNKICNTNHCLNFCLPEEKSEIYHLRPKGHNFLLPKITSELCKNSFINRCLYQFI